MIQAEGWGCRISIRRRVKYIVKSGSGAEASSGASHVRPIIRVGLCPRSRRADRSLLISRFYIWTISRIWERGRIGAYFENDKVIMGHQFGIQVAGLWERWQWACEDVNKFSVRPRHRMWSWIPLLYDGRICRSWSMRLSSMSFGAFHWGLYVISNYQLCFSTIFWLLYTSLSLQWMQNRNELVQLYEIILSYLMFLVCHQHESRKLFRIIA